MSTLDFNPRFSVAKRCALAALTRRFYLYEVVNHGKVYSGFFRTLSEAQDARVGREDRLGLEEWSCHRQTNKYGQRYSMRLRLAMAHRTPELDDFLDD